jgi:hypothetical protein
LAEAILTAPNSLDYVPQFPAAIQEISKGLADGSIKRKFHIVEGIEQAPVALPMLFSGGNTGKLCVVLLLFTHRLFNLPLDVLSRVVKVSEEPKAIAKL